MTNTTATSAAAVTKTVMDEARRAIPLETPEELWSANPSSALGRWKERTSEGIGWWSVFRGSEVFPFLMLHFKSS